MIISTTRKYFCFVFFINLTKWIGIQEDTTIDTEDITTVHDQIHIVQAKTTVQRETTEIILLLVVAVVVEIIRLITHHLARQQVVEDQAQDTAAVIQTRDPAITVLEGTLLHRALLRDLLDGHLMDTTVHLEGHPTLTVQEDHPLLLLQ